MEQKNRLFFSLVVIGLILGTLFISFGRNLFGLDIPSVSLPTPSASDSQDSTQDSEHTHSYESVSVSPQTVQSILATLTRSDSYYREVQVETFWTDGAQSTTIQVWANDGFLHTVQTLPIGVTRHDLVGSSTQYYWYEETNGHLTAPVEHNSGDLVQRLPTYETILTLDPAHIIRAGYKRKLTFPCIYVEAYTPSSGIQTRYWVSIENGLLISAEATQEEELIYSMNTIGTLQTPCPSNVSFLLPDGSQPKP